MIWINLKKEEMESDNDVWDDWDEINQEEELDATVWL